MWALSAASGFGSSSNLARKARLAFSVPSVPSSFAQRLSAARRALWDLWEGVSVVEAAISASGAEGAAAWEEAVEGVA